MHQRSEKTVAHSSKHPWRWQWNGSRNKMKQNNNTQCLCANKNTTRKKNVEQSVTITEQFSFLSLFLIIIWFVWLLCLMCTMYIHFYFCSSVNAAAIHRTKKKKIIIKNYQLLSLSCIWQCYLDSCVPFLICFVSHFLFKKSDAFSWCFFFFLSTFNLRPIYFTQISSSVTVKRLTFDAILVFSQF